MIHGRIATYRRHGCRCAECSLTNYLWCVQRGRAIPRLPVEPIFEVMTPTQRHDYRGWLYSHQKHGVRLYEADRMCVRLGLHPMSVYGDLWLSDMWGKEFGDAA